MGAQAIFFGAGWSVLKTVTSHGVTGLFLLIDSIVYYILSFLFELFNKLAGAEFIMGEEYNLIVQRIYVIVGICMLFFLAYSLLKALVNPEEINKVTSKIVQKFIISIILLTIMPTLFSYAFQIQSIIIGENVIPNIIFGVTDNETQNENQNTIVTVGRQMSLSTLEAFLRVGNDGNVESSAEGNLTWNDLKANILETGDFSNIIYMAEAIKDNDNVTYKPIISTLAGGILAYIILSFCLDLGIRFVKLLFYQVIAPIPIIMQIIPEKKSVLSNWIKKVLATYFEVFVRIFIIYIILFFVSLVLNGSLLSNLFDNEDFNLLAKVIIFLSIFIFGKQLPKLISEVTGISSGNIKLGIGSKIKEGVSAIPVVGKPINNLASRALGATTGALGGFSLGVMNGAGMAGLGYGLVNGWKGKGTQFSKQRTKFYNDVMDKKGKPSITGGQKVSDKITKSAKDNVNKKYLDSVKSRVEDFENSDSWINEFNKNYATEHGNKAQQLQNLQVQYQIQKDNYRKNANQKIVALQKQQHHDEEVFENDRGSRIMAERQRYIQDKKAFDEQKAQMSVLESQYNTELQKFNTEKDQKLKSLNYQAKTASDNHNIQEMQRINREIEELNNTEYKNDALMQKINEIKNKTFDESMYQNRLNQIKNEKFDDSKYREQIANLQKDYYNETLENAIKSAKENLTKFETAFNSGDHNAEELQSVREATVKKMRSENTKYKANIDFTAKKDREKATKEYMESQEGMNQIAAWERAMESYNKTHTTAPITPSLNDNKDKKGEQK